MLENRRHTRIREITDIRWAVLGQDASGKGKVLNISASGLLLQTDEHFDPRNQGMLYIDAVEEKPLDFGAKKGKIVWIRRMPEGRLGYQCGVEFLKTAGWDKPLHDWIDLKTSALAQAVNVNILNNYIA